MKPKPCLEVDGIDIISPLTLKGKSGPWSIEVEIIRRGEPVVLVNMRNAIYSGLKTKRVSVGDWDFRIHKLMRGGLITSDCPNEIYTQAKDFNKCEGRVLVGGLGIGMASTYIANNPRVLSVTTVEISRSLIRFIKPQLPETDARHDIEHGDLFKFIPKATRLGLEFDTAYFDIWSPTGESAWMDYVVPLRRLMGKHYPGVKVYNWLESDMLGQLRVSLNMVITGRPFDGPKTLKELGVSPQAKDMWILVFKPFDVFKKSLGPKDGPEEAKNVMDVYLNCVGTPAWEVRFGKLWDSWRPPTRVEKNRIFKKV